MPDYQQDVEGARLCLTALSLWLSILTETCGEDAAADFETHLAAIARSLDRLDPAAPPGLH
ncbi:MAG: hypothetical protein AB1647_06700 [Pseudomonadota bacterium]|jgi:hypothetical protein